MLIISVIQMKCKALSRGCHEYNRFDSIYELKRLVGINWFSEYLIYGGSRMYLTNDPWETILDEAHLDETERTIRTRRR